MDQDDQELDERELPDESDMDSRDEDAYAPDTESCPHCRKPVYAESEFCPHCGRVISWQRRPKPIWIVIAIVICIALLLLWAF